MKSPRFITFLVTSPATALHVSVPELSLAGTLKLIDEQSAAASTTFWILMEEHECLL